MSEINTTKQIECESCLEAGEHTTATTHSTNPDYENYELCDECAAEYDSRNKQLSDKN